MVGTWVMDDFEILTTVLMDIKVFWDMMPSHLLVTDCVLLGKIDFCHNTQNPRNLRHVLISWTPTLEAAERPETLTITHRPYSIDYSVVFNKE
jgi:hypothetical protein